MTQSSEEKFEHTLERALKMREAGESDERIFSAFPEYGHEFKEIFSLLEVIRANKDAVTLPEAVAKRIVDRAPVTREKYHRSILSEAEKKGRTADGYANFFNPFSSMNWKLFAPIAVVALAAVLVFSSKTATQPTTPAAPDSESVALADNEAALPSAEVVPSEGAVPAVTEPSVAVPPATGNVDATVDAILASATGEATVLDDVNADLALLDLDSQAFNEFTQSYGEEQF